MDLAQHDFFYYKALIFDFCDVWFCMKCGMISDEVYKLLAKTEVADPNGSCLFADGLPTDTVGSQNFQTFSTRQTPHLDD